MHIAVIGAKGMLGRELCRVLREGHQITAWDIDEIDITDRPGTLQRLTSLRPDLIVNSAAFVDVDRCETEADKAWLINAVGAQNLALAAQQSGSALLYISTDYIFDGETAEDYDEVAPTRPINHYGRSKLAGEVLSTQICSRTYIVRTAWLIGNHPNNYVERVLQAADREGVVRMAPDQIESPTYTTHLAEAISHLIDTGAFGRYNVTSLGACTRVEFAKFVLEQAGRDTPVETADVSTLRRVAKRPRRTVLDCRLYRLVTGQTLPHWHDAIKAYLAQARAASEGASVA
jgi:dTDP-4-dehydrorhamnose reductase